jgi:CheY-like chemotaxis protein
VPVALADLTSALLAQVGYDVEIARCGTEAVAICLQRHFDLVLMDCRMLGLDGYTAARLIRNNERER